MTSLLYPVPELIFLSECQSSGILCFPRTCWVQDARPDKTRLPLDNGVLEQVGVNNGIVHGVEST